jgi:hypothetical protein
MGNEAVMIQNHEIRFATVDLGATTKEIRDQLLQILEYHRQCDKLNGPKCNHLNAARIEKKDM